MNIEQTSTGSFTAEAINWPLKEVEKYFSIPLNMLLQFNLVSRGWLHKERLPDKWPFYTLP